MTNPFECTGDFEIDGFRLVNTCGACPEQYDVFRGADRVGYLRLRHGFFSADYPDVWGDPVYESQTVGDGIFHSAQERETHLRYAVEAIKSAMIAARPRVEG